MSINVHGYTVNGNHEELFAIIDSLRNAPWSDEHLYSREMTGTV